MPRYWVLQGEEVAGPLDAADVCRLEGVDLVTLVSPDRWPVAPQDWQFLGNYPELFGHMTGPMPRNEERARDAAQVLAWLGDVLKKVRRILSSEHAQALYAQSRIDAWAERARDLGVRLGLYGRRLEDLEQGTRLVDRRLILADAWRQELLRQAASAEEAARGLKEASARAAERRGLLLELIVLQKQANEAAAQAAKKKKKPLLGALNKLKSLTFKTPGKTKLKFKPLS